MSEDNNDDVMGLKLWEVLFLGAAVFIYALVFTVGYTA